MSRALKEKKAFVFIQTGAAHARARAAAAGWTVVLVLTLSSCTPGSAPGALPDRAASTQQSPADHAVFAGSSPGPGWELSLAVHRGDADAEDVLDDTPGLEWTLDYEVPAPEGPGTNPFLKVSGFSRSVDEFRATSTPEGSAVSDGQIGGRQAYWGSSPNAPELGSFLVLALQPAYCVELVASGLSPLELRDIASELRPATLAQWRAMVSNSRAREVASVH